MMRVSIQEGGAEEAFAAIRPEWQKLFAESLCAPFLAWEWMSAWYRAFAANCSPYILKVYRGEKLIGLLPMFLDDKNTLRIRFTRLCLMGAGHGGADHLGVIARPQDETLVLQAIFDHISERRDFDLLRFENLDAGSAVERLLTGYGNKAIRVSASPAGVCPRIDLASGWESVLDQSKRKSNFKRRLKQIRKMPGFEFRSITSPADTGAAFERFLDLHDKRRAAAGGSELSGHPKLVSFHRGLVPALAKADLVRFDELWVEGKCRSSIYGLNDGRVFYFYNSGFDPAWAHSSVGLVVLGLSIENACLRGCTVYDFLRGDEPYKFDWASGAVNLIDVSVDRGTPLAVVLGHLEKTVSAVKNLSKAVLPVGIAETVAGWRRSWKRNYQLSDR